MTTQITTYHYPDVTMELRVMCPKYDVLRKLGLYETSDMLYYLKMEKRYDGVYNISYERR